MTLNFMFKLILKLSIKLNANLDKKIASNPDLKKAVSQQRHPKSWRRHQQKGTK